MAHFGILLALLIRFCHGVVIHQTLLDIVGSDGTTGNTVAQNILTTALSEGKELSGLGADSDMTSGGNARAAQMLFGANQANAKTRMQGVDTFTSWTPEPGMNIQKDSTDMNWVAGWMIVAGVSHLVQTTEALSGDPYWYDPISGTFIKDQATIQACDRATNIRGSETPYAMGGQVGWKDTQDNIQIRDFRAVFLCRSMLHDGSQGSVNIFAKQNGDLASMSQALASVSSQVQLMDKLDIDWLTFNLGSILYHEVNHDLRFGPTVSPSSEVYDFKDCIAGKNTANPQNIVFYAVNAYMISHHQLCVEDASTTSVDPGFFGPVPSSKMKRRDTEGPLNITDSKDDVQVETHRRGREATYSRAKRWIA